MPTTKTFSRNNSIPTQLTEKQFKAFILPHLPVATRGPTSNIPKFKIFNYILKIIYTGMQWKELPIEKNADGKPEIHYTRVFRIYQHWVQFGSLLTIFEASVMNLYNNELLDLSILHGDGTTTAAKKGGEGIGYSGHKRIKGDKIVAFVDRNCNVLSPFTVAPGNRHETTLFEHAFENVRRIFKKLGCSLKGIIASLDSAYDSSSNRKKIFNAGMIPNIKQNPRNRCKEKRGRKRLYEDWIFQERFETVERVFAWEDKFKRLLLRFERISLHHFGMKLIAYTMINLRHFCSI
jgi:transposase